MKNKNLNTSKTVTTALPSKKQLFFSILAAAAGAGLLAVLVVLPAEKGVDPTGFGKLTGLTQMGEIKTSLQKEIEAEANSQPEEPQEIQQPHKVYSGKQNKASFTVILNPDQTAEIKLKMIKNAEVNYSWNADGSEVGFNNHADAAGIKYFGYSKGKSSSDKGTITAAFDGQHGWFWRNRNKKSVTIRLYVDGEFSEHKIVQ